MLKKKKIILIFVLVFIISFCSIFGIAYALYTRTNNFLGIVQSEEFYLNSSVLKKEDVVYELNSGTTYVEFDILNYENSLRYSTEDIVVEITSTDGTLSTEEVTLKGDEASKTVVTLSGLVDGGTYTVTVTGKAGYQEILKATFVVRNNINEIYKYIDNSNPNYVLVTIWTKDVSGEVTINFELANLVVDNTWIGMEHIDSNSSFNVTVESNSSYVYRFFKTSTSDVSKLSILYSGNEVSEKTPS